MCFFKRSSGILAMLVILFSSVIAGTPKSVTEFHDDFESGTSQWILSGTWGLDTMYEHTGNYSLADSPSNIYPDNTESYPEGGMVCEILPSMDFTGAANVDIDFWIKYDIEANFDFLHLQCSTDSINWTTMKSWSGLGVDWYQEDFSLGAYAGESNVRIRFILVSDIGMSHMGSYIDELNIVPSTDDTSPPFVTYTKVRDYYDNNPEGFEITTDILDFTGVSYAKVLYSVNGDPEVLLDPSTINGDEYYFIIPEQTPGDYVEFRFDCEDTATIPNQGYTGPFFYTSGLHQLYDSGLTDFTADIYNNPVSIGYIEAISVRFTIFKDDLVGALVRGYNDGMFSSNTPMLIQVYDDDNGLPGNPLLPVPVQCDNPATLQYPDAWGYVDLSSNIELVDLEGDFHIAIYSLDTRTTVPTQAMVSDRSCVKYVPDGGGATIWEQSTTMTYSIRAVTTNNEYSPGIIQAGDHTITEFVLPDTFDSVNLSVLNVGDAELTYDASIEYDGYFAEDFTFYSEDFDIDLIWNPAGDLAWFRDTGSSNLDGTPYARIDALTTGGNVTKSGTLTSGIINASIYGSVAVEFDQYRSDTSGSYALEVSTDGTNWNELYGGSSAIGDWGNPDHRIISVPAEYCLSTTQLRFNVGLSKNNGTYAVDNIVIKGSQPYSWLTLDGGTTTSGTIAVAGSDIISVGLDAMFLDYGESYTAKIMLNSAFSTDSVRVELNAQEDNPPPEPFIFTNISDTDLVLGWVEVPGAAGYYIYTSTDPYGTFTKIDSVGTNQYITPANQKLMFYQVTATDGTKSGSNKLFLNKQKK